MRAWLGLAVGVIFAGSSAMSGCRRAGPKDTFGIRAMEYAFVGAPTNLTAGQHTFTLRNDGKIDHEMVIVKLPPGTGLDQLLAEPPYQAEAAVTVLGRSSAKPGQNGEHPVVATMAPGSYAMWCFLSNRGPPHVYQGMRTSFTVT